MNTTNGKPTITICPKCKAICHGKILSDDKGISLSISCNEHGEQIADLYEDKEFYNEVITIIKSNKKNLDLDLDSNTEFITFKRPEEMITSIHINFTEKCNLNCPNCFAASESMNNKENEINDIDIQTILDQLENFKNLRHKPMVVIIGGEPTVRQDLPDVIHEISSRGFNVRLSTNGILINKEDYMKKLVENGLNWLLLQFDGFNPNSSIQLRKVDLIDKKFEVIDKAEKFHLKTHLITMVSKGINQEDMMHTLKFAFEKPSVFAVNFYPISLMGRYSHESTSILDCMKELEIQSNGSISIQDFIDSKKIWNRFYKLFKRPILRQQLCTYPIFLYKHKNVIYPINRLFKIKNILKHPIFSIRYLFKSLRLINWANSPTKDFLYLNIEKFYDSEAMDLNEAYDCHNVFLTSKGFIPFCIYNAIYRSKKCF